MYVKRNASDEVIGLFVAQQYPGQEYLPDNHPDVLAMHQREAEERTAAEQTEVLKQAAITDALPDWPTVQNAINTIFPSSQQPFMTKLCKVVYWGIKGEQPTT